MKRSNLSPPPPYSGPLADIIESIQNYIHMPDPTPIALVLASAMAARVDEGSPVWMMLVGPPSSGKSDLLYFVSAADKTFAMATLTEASLLSGSGKHDRIAGKSTGGLLRQVGDQGLLIAKDFTSVLNMHRDHRAAVLAALREIYDGMWVRHVGSDGGKEMKWEGRLGFLGGVTDVIDAHHSVISAMGDRFIYCRMEPVVQKTVGQVVLSRNGDRDVVRGAIRAETTEFLEAGFDQLRLHRPLLSAEKDWIITLTEVACRGRSAVERNFRNEIQDVLEPESIGRLTESLGQLYRVLECIGCSRTETQRVVVKAAMDCVPRKRLRLIELLAHAPGGLATRDMCKDRLTDHPVATVKRALEDMECIRIVKRTGAGVTNDPQVWRLNEEFRELWENLGLGDLNL